MAIDTQQKRMSAMNLACPWRGPMVDATESGTTQGNRQAAAFYYSGILATTVVLIGPACITAIHIAVPEVTAINITKPETTAVNIDKPEITAINVECN